MAITTAACISAKPQLWQGRHNVRATGGDQFKVALYDVSATLDANTTVYSTTNEVVGTGYTAGGANLVAVDPVASGSAGIASFNNVTWSASTIASAGCEIYNSSYGNAAVSVHSFGGTVTSNAGDFTLLMPNFTETEALWRLV